MKYLKLLAPVLVALVIFILPIPQGLTPNAWLYFAIFMGVVVGLIFEPIAPALIGLIGIGLCVWFRIGPEGSGALGAKITADTAIKWGLAGFSDKTIWLIFAAFMIGLGYQKSGLGRRIALLLLRILGRTTLGLGYAIAIADGILAPFIPSNSARSGGTLYPIVSSIPPMLGSTPDKEPRKVGSYLVWVSLAATCVTSSMFFTGLAPNLLAMTTAQQSGVEVISWMGWFMAFLPCGILLFLATPFLTYIFYPPTSKGSPEAVEWAKEELSKLGATTLKEWLMLALAVFALVLWIFGGKFIDATAVALTVMIGMVLLGIVTWNDIIGNKAAWNVLAWFGSLVTLANGLKNVNFLNFIAGICKENLQGVDPVTAMIILVVLFYLLHYFFASTTAHVTALLGLFITIATSVNSDPAYVREVTLYLMLTLGVMGILTPYGTGPSPVWFGSGYVSGKDFWRLGFIFGMIYLIATLVICIPWVRYVAHAWL